MTAGISGNLLTQLEELVANRFGLHFPKERYRNLERGIAIAAKELHFAEPASFVEALLAAPLNKDQIGILASALTVGETYFFREKRIFEILEEHILREWISARRTTTRRLEIWSAGCCTGEEAYSLAILIHKMVPDLANWHITILATDINRRFLEKAAAGIYSEWSFRGAPGWVKERYFKKVREGRYEILPAIREMVKFTQLNLVEGHDPSPANLTSGIDLVLCRNVLMYFVPWQVNRVLDNFYRRLIDDGWLIVSPSEISYLQTTPFFMVNFPGAMLHQKQQVQTGAAKAPPVSSPAYFEVPEMDTGYFLPQWPPQSNGISQEPGAKSQEPRATPPPPPRVQAIIQDLQSIPKAPRERIEPPLPPASDARPGSDLPALYEKGHYAELARELSGWLTRCQAKHESPLCGYDPFALLIKSYANLGNLDMALEWCDRGIALDKLNPSPRYLRAVVFQERGQPEEALASLKQAIYLDPNFILAHFALGNVTQKLGRFTESEKHFANTMRLLNGLGTGEMVPESEGMTVGYLLEMIRATFSKEKKA